MKKFNFFIMLLTLSNWSLATVSFKGSFKKSNGAKECLEVVNIELNYNDKNDYQLLMSNLYESIEFPKSSRKNGELIFSSYATNLFSSKSKQSLAGLPLSFYLNYDDRSKIFTPYVALVSSMNNSFDPYKRTYGYALLIKSEINMSNETFKYSITRNDLTPHNMYDRNPYFEETPVGTLDCKYSIDKKSFK